MIKKLMTLFFVFLLLTLSSGVQEKSVSREANTKYEVENYVLRPINTFGERFKQKVELTKGNQSEDNKLIKKTMVKKKDKVKHNNWMLFEITSYTNGRESTGKRKGDKNYGITASGKHTKEGRTVSADIRVLPMGTVIYIDGVGKRVVEDTGSAIKGYKLDLFIEDLDKALEFGRKKNVRVKIIKMGDTK
ncbi:3D domain-containing protein [Paenibacillus pini]|uniref:3D domain-containing protein n=1 Tax=Paenibacillus pini JCM 16418 TaxID=1236976 RepID=W7Z8N7_9BACL|nr:3D domain-containing protein [Paenibacillus pini]GAF10799.1 hypothetical protein JCM16418_5021 [Paenibacillus pini JCM 16418]